MSVSFNAITSVIQEQKPLKSILKKQESQVIDHQEVSLSVTAEIHELWNESKELRDTAIQNNNARLYEIDPELVGSPRWTGCCMISIFHYIACAFSSWWNQDEIKTLQAANKILGNPAFQNFKSEKKWGSAAVQALNHSKISESQGRQQVMDLSKTLDKVLKLSISWADSQKKPLTHELKFQLSAAEKIEKRTTSRSANKNMAFYRQARASGRLNHDVRCGTYDNPDDDKRDVIEKSEINWNFFENQQPRRRRDLAEVNRQWNEEYNGK